MRILHHGLFLGWKMGFEPTTNGTTNHYSNRLSYIHRLSPANIGLFFELDKRKMLFLLTIDINLMNGILA